MKSFFVSVIFLTALTSDIACASPKPSKPNIVVILADDLGWGAVSYHSDFAQTPNIDRLTAQGIELDQFYVAPMCSPTRAGLLTGRYPIRFGLARAVIPPQRNFGLSTDERTIADALKDAGYQHRAVFGKWHLGHHRRNWHPLSRGFTQFEGHYNGAIDYFSLTREGERDWHENFVPSHRQGYSTDLISQAACEFIKDASKEESPYFCYVPFNAPHSPFQAKPADIAKFSQSKQPTNEQKLKAMISSLDQGIGRILEAIKASGEEQNTLVWFFSDNGGVGRFKRNNWPLRGSKLTTFEGGIRVPACVRWPARWDGKRKLANTMGYIDVFPTLLDCAGVDAPLDEKTAPFDGVSQLDVFTGRVTEIPKRDWYSYHGQAGADRETIAVKTSQWKLIIVGPDIRSTGLGENHQTYLFQISDDPLEKNNLTKQHPEVVATLFQKLREYRSLQPANAVPIYSQGKQGFKPWKNWDIRSRK